MGGREERVGGSFERVGTGEIWRDLNSTMLNI